MKQLVKWVRHNQGVFVALIICSGMLIWTLGCESKVTSLTDPTKKVTADELSIEVEGLLAKLNIELNLIMKSADVKFKDLARQDAIKQKMMDFSLLAAKTGTLNPSGLVGLIAGIVGIGAVIDNRIKDKVIKNRPLAKVVPAAGETVS